MDEVITTNEATKILGITRQTLYKLVENGTITGKKVGSRYKFIRKDLLNYIKSNDGIKNLEEYREWVIKGDFSTKGIIKMAKKTFQQLSSNIEELIVNSYDEDATEVNITIDYDKNTISVIDDGNGMDEKGLASYVIYGESNKNPNFRSKIFRRSPIGEYGMGGKLAITNLCGVCKIITRSSGNEHVFFMNREQLNKAKYVSDISSKVLTKKCSDNLHGTSIYMEKLNYKTIDYGRLIERFSSKMPRSQNFKIILSIVKNGEFSSFEIQEPARRAHLSEGMSLCGGHPRACTGTRRIPGGQRFQRLFLVDSV